MLERVQPSVDRLIAHVEQNSDYHQPGVAADKSHKADKSDKADKEEAQP
jgi:hypothetical protein